LAWFAIGIAHAAEPVQPVMKYCRAYIDGGGTGTSSTQRRVSMRLGYKLTNAGDEVADAIAMTAKIELCVATAYADGRDPTFECDQVLFPWAGTVPRLGGPASGIAVRVLERQWRRDRTRRKEFDRRRR
jgi:hypothetical protein